MIADTYIHAPASPRRQHRGIRRLAATLLGLILASVGSWRAYDWVGPAGDGDVFAMAIVLAITWLFSVGLQCFLPRLISLRDGIFRYTTMFMAALCAVAVANTVEKTVAYRLMASPLEGISAVAGGASGLLVFGLVGAGAYLLPDLLLRAQLNGRMTSGAVGETLWFGNLGFIFTLVFILAAAIIEPGVQGLSIAALAAFAGFALPRILLSRPRADEGTPLWIVLLRVPNTARPKRFVRRLASAWKHGPVTWVAPAQAAPILYGSHLHLADRVGRLKALFPELTIECMDWHGVLPPEPQWEALPVRELYPKSSVLVDALAALLPPNARVAVVLDTESEIRQKTSAQTGTQRIQELAIALRYRIPASHTSVLCFPGVDLAEVHAGFPGQVRELTSKALSASGAKQCLEALSVKPEEVLPVRRVLLVYQGEDGDIARRVLAQIDGKRDAQGMRVGAQVHAADASHLVRRASLWWASSRRLLTDDAQRVFAQWQGRSRLARLMRWFLLALLPQRRGFDLIVLEPEYRRAQGIPAGFKDLMIVVEMLANRVIAVLRGSTGHEAELSLPIGFYNGAIRAPLGASEYRVAAYIAEQILALQFEPLAFYEPARAIGAEPSHTPEYRAGRVATSLAWPLPASTVVITVALAIAAVLVPAIVSGIVTAGVTRQQLEELQTVANAAMQEAKRAAAEAQAAEQSVAAARISADAAQACCTETNDKLDRLFRKAMEQ